MNKAMTDVLKDKRKTFLFVFLFTEFVINLCPFSIKKHFKL